jgi:hypothetical protein
MKYAQQAQTALDKLDMSLGGLRTLIKNGKINEALQYMEKGDLKDKFESLQNIITISQTGTLGARGIQNTGTL